MESLTSLTAYFESISKNLKDLNKNNPTTGKKRFFIMSFEEIIFNMKSVNADFKCLVIEPYELDGIDGLSDNKHAGKVFAFNVLDFLNDHRDYKKKLELLDSCEDVVWKILSKILNDQQSFAGNKPLTRTLRNIDWNKMRMHHVLPLSDGEKTPQISGVYGVRCIVSFNQPVTSNLKYNPSDWS